MSNNFPPLPADLQLASVMYLMNFGGGQPSLGPALTFSGAVTSLFGAIVGLGSQGGIEFTFTTPGTFGSFDQAAAEATMTTIARHIFQLMSDLTGIPTATLEQAFSIQRIWTWTDPAGNKSVFTDTMPFTAS